MSPWASDYRMRSTEESSEQYYPSLRAAYLAHTTTSVFSFVQFGLKWLYAGRLQSNSPSHKVTFVYSGSVGRAQFLHTICLLLRPPNSPLRFPSLRLPARGRNYAKKARSTSSLKPGSQQPLTKPADIAEHEKCEEKMKASVEWLRRDCADASARAAGRVTPALLANVRDWKRYPSITPQRQDTRTLRIPVPKPTLGTESSVVTAAGKKAEDARMQCRKLHQASVKKGKYEKRSIELEVFQDLLDKHIADIDKIVAGMKKTLGLSR
ncbi:hypothetical protein ARMSODRAFT_975907 [Armillaria solidipes]|uniref:Ribosome recycling factor domain-containing protein n=1 Tax=Armillaria solidipes TaxID=1076256 RepID=A0A2H3BX88_9AGAR|nr:hypothetical protein ARMSODRAFT_975907 [Armillaria solidipes]